MAVHAPQATTQIDTLIVANHAEAINGLLYLSGAGWTDLHRHIQGGLAPVSHFGIGMVIRVPWQETNHKHSYIVEVRTSAADAVIVHAEGEISVGRPPQLPPGSIQHTVVAITVDLTFPHAGSYQVIAMMDGKDAPAWTFRVHDTHE